MEGSVRLGVTTRKIGYLPQLSNTGFHLPLSLFDVVRISTPSRVTREEVVSLGLLEASRLDLGWNTASGGERKRALLSRVLLKRPQLLILDEPFNHLDGASRLQIQRVLANYIKREPLAGGLLVSHDPVDESEWSGVKLLPLPLDKFQVGSNG
jgi:zinc/manganese transport system ATP-binding protein/zinc transport system ATP-binding protein